MHDSKSGRVGSATLAATALAAAVMAAPAVAQDLPDLAPEPTLDDFLRVAEGRNAGLEASRALWRASSEAVSVAGSLPDPRLSVGTMLSEVETRVGPQKESVALMQRLPWFGKLGLRREAASAQAEAAHSGWANDRLRLRNDVKLAWYELYWLDRQTSLARENLDLLSNLERVVREKYRVAAAAHADLVRIQVELGVLEDRVRSLEDRRRPVAARMNALLHRAPDAPVPSPSELPDIPRAPDAAPVLDSVRRGSPRLRALDHSAAAARVQEQLARRDRWPDWALGLKWIRVDEAIDPSLEDSGRDAMMVEASVDLPIFRGKYGGAIRGAQARLVAARSKRADEEDTMVAEAETVLFGWRDADRRADLYGDALIPKARESLAATETAYRTGEGGFLDLIEAQRTLLALELEHERARTERGRSAARLAALTGTEWEGEAAR